MSFDITKPFRTLDGRKVEIFGKSSDGNLLGVCHLTDRGHTTACVWEETTGRNLHPIGGNEARTLVNVPEKHVRWVSIYQGRGMESGMVSNIRIPPDSETVAIIRVEFELGQFDE